MKKSGAAVALLLLLVAALGTIQATPAAALDAPAQAYVTKINALRASLGLRPLVVDEQLSALAHDHDLEMAAAGRLFHTASLAAGVTTPWASLGENVGTGSQGADLFAAFVASPGHYANIVNPNFDRVGIGSDVVDGVEWTTQRFLQTAPAPTPAPKPAASAPAAAAPTVTTAPTATTPPSTAAPAPRVLAGTAPSGPAAAPAPTPAAPAPSTSAPSAPVRQSVPSSAPTTTGPAATGGTGAGAGAPADDALEAGEPAVDRPALAPAAPAAPEGADGGNGPTVPGPDAVADLSHPAVATVPIVAVTPAGGVGAGPVAAVAFGVAFVLSIATLALIAVELRGRRTASA